jgi:hypothetical protein
VPSKRLQGQLQTQHSVDIGNYIKDKHNIKSKKNNNGDNNHNYNNNSNNNPILYYLCAEPTAARPITDTTQCR